MSKLLKCFLKFSGRELVFLIIWYLVERVFEFGECKILDLVNGYFRVILIFLFIISCYEMWKVRLVCGELIFKVDEYLIF